MKWCLAFMAAGFIASAQAADLSMFTHLGNGCADALSSAEDLPVNDFFRPGEFVGLANTIPESARSLRAIAKVARDLQDPSRMDFYDFVGAFVDVGFSDEYLDQATKHPLDAFGRRQQQVLDIFDYAAEQGLIESPFTIQEVNLMAIALGNLTPQRPVEWTRLMNQEDVLWAAVDEYVRRHRAEMPGLRDMLLQFESAQRVMLVPYYVKNALPRTVVESMLPKLRARLGDGRLDETAQESEFFHLLDVVSRRDHRGITKAFQAPSRVVVAEWDDMALSGSLNSLIATLLASVSRADLSDEDAAELSNPIVAQFGFESSLSQDTYVDRGLRSIVRRVFAEVVLDKRTLGGREVKRRLRTAVEDLIKGQRRIWQLVREETKPVAARTVQPDREQRMREYARQQRVSLEKLAVASPPTVERSAKTVPASPADAEAWDALESEGLTAAAARAMLSSVITPDRVFRTRLQSGFIYRIELAKDLISQLAAPQPGEPEDPRQWFRAIREGPARAQGDSGWKKLKVPLMGVYDWEIKLVGSKYRMLGFRKGDGAWRFERIKAMH